MFLPYDGHRPPQWPFGIDKTSSLSKGLVSCWPMMEPAAYAVGAIVRDISGNGNHGTVANTGFAKDISEFGVAPLGVNGSDREIVLPNVSSRFVANASIYCWMRVDAAGGAPFRFGSSAGDYHMPFSDNNYYDGTFRNARLSLGAIISTSQFAVWHTYAVSTDATTWRVYYNGLEVAQNAAETTVKVEGGSGEAPRLMNGDSVLGGNRCLGGPARFIALWNRTLTPNEHFSLWNPATRWDLYEELRTVIASVPAVAGEDTDTILFTPGSHQPVIESPEVVGY